MDHPHHTLFIILALANANKDELLSKPEAARRSRITKNAPKESSQLDEVFGLNTSALCVVMFLFPKNVPFLILIFWKCVLLVVDSKYFIMMMPPKIC